jgi:hypothetical protein
MADLKPIGSEKLPLDKKLQRIMEIANYGITPKTNTHKTASLEYSIKAADGNNYGIIRENAQYMILKEGTNGYEYMNGMKNNSRYTFNSYSEALKKLNLLMKPINENYNNGKQLNLIGEQEDDTKFVLKQPESETADSEETEDFSFDDALVTDDGGEDLDMDMDIETQLDGGEMDTEVNVDVESDEDGTKAVQKLTGKLGQKLRELPEPEMTADIIKYVLNSIISAVDLEKLSEDDKDEIVGKFEDDDIDYTEEGEFDVDLSGDEELDLGDEELDFGGEGEDMDLETELEEGMVMGDDEEIDENLGALARMAVGAAAAGFGERAADRVFNEGRVMNESLGGAIGALKTLLDVAVKDPKLAMKIVNSTLQCLNFRQIGELVDLIDWVKGSAEACGTVANIVANKDCMFDFQRYLTSDNFDGAVCLVEKLGPDMLKYGMENAGDMLGSVSGMFGLNEEGKKWKDVTGDGKFTQADLLKLRGVELDEEDTLNFAGDEGDVDAVAAIADVFNESRVNRTLSKYFQLTPQEKKQQRIRQQRRIEEQKRRKENFLNESIKQVKRKRLVESSFSSYEQERTTKQFLKENRDFNFIGKNKRGGLVFKENKNLVEITTTGKVL